MLSMEPAGYEINLQGENGATALHVSGELDLAGAERFCVDLSRWAEQVPGEVDLDLRDLRFVDSCGMQALVRARDELSRAGRNLRVIEASRPVRRVFTIAGLAEMFGIDAPQ